MKTISHEIRSPKHRESRSRFRRTMAIARRYLGGRPRSTSVRTVVLACVAVFGIALGARLLLLADQRTTIEAAHEVSYTQPRHYQNAGRRILDDPVQAMLLDATSDRGRERLLAHPPGYPILIAIVFGTLGDSQAVLRGGQLVLDSMSAVLLLLIASRLFRQSIAVVTGLIAALSPQLAWNALVLQPDTVAIVPILAAVLILAWKPRPTLRSAVAAGVLVGVSCWLRSNAMLLAPFLALVAIPMLFPAGRRTRAACALILATFATVAPVTIRNWYVFDRFIPLSLGAGITFAEGIGDFDPDRRFGIPSTDVEMAKADAVWAGRPEYAKSIWVPNAVERDRERFRRAADVVLRNPVWFSGVMARRAALMMRSNDDVHLGWPFDTAHAPLVSLDPPYGHDRIGSVAATFPTASSISAIPVQLQDGESWPLAFLPVNTGEDYLIRIPVSEVVGAGSLEIRNDTGSLIASIPVRELGDANRRRRRKANRDQRAATTELLVPMATSDMRNLELSFRADDGVRRRGLTLDVGPVESREMGPTPGQWTRGPRWVIRIVQRSLFRTSRWPALVIVGAAILLLGHRRRALVSVAAVPAYYLFVQSALHTEFRYVLAVHSLSAILVAVALVSAAVLSAAAAHTAFSWIRILYFTRVGVEAA